MPSQLLNPTQQPTLQPAHGLWQQYNPADAPFAFRAKDRNEAQHWQTEARTALAATLGFQDSPAVPLEPQVIEQVDRGDFVREKILIHTAADVEMPVYLLLPKGSARPLATVLAFAGHGYGAKDIVGLWEDGSERENPDGYHADFAIALCRRGFAVAAPEIACFGERQTDFAYLTTGQSAPTSCTHAAMLASHLGGSVAGMRVRDARRLVDYLETRPECDTARLGAMGISGGGMHTLFSAAIDTRIKAAVISGYFSTFQHSILAMHHCACNFVPGLARFGEMYDLAGLLAPRPLLVEAGTHDPIFPIDAVRASVKQAEAVYAVFGAGPVETDFFEGRHRINGQRAYDFLAGQLG
jgi:dienelactone hydrolase